MVATIPRDDSRVQQKTQNVQEKNKQAIHHPITLPEGYLNSYHKTIIFTSKKMI